MRCGAVQFSAVQSLIESASETEAEAKTTGGAEGRRRTDRSKDKKVFSGAFGTPPRPRPAPLPVSLFIANLPRLGVGSSECLSRTAIKHGNGGRVGQVGRDELGGWVRNLDPSNSSLNGF